MDAVSLGLVFAGFLAQIVDGSLGMAFGVSATTVMLHLGLAPATASLVVHFAEIFTTAASGASHIRAGNVNWTILRRLAIPGVAGGILGSTVLASFDGHVLRPWISGYMLLMGLVIVAKAFHWRQRTREFRWAPGLGLVGGFLDAVGGGGWGPIVTSTLVGHGGSPRHVIGTVNTTEFLVTTATSATLVFHIGLAELWPALFLVLGGVAAAPLGGYLVRAIPERAMMFAVGALITGLAIVQLGPLLLAGG